MTAVVFKFENNAFEHKLFYEVTVKFFRDRSITTFNEKVICPNL